MHPIAPQSGGWDPALQMMTIDLDFADVGR